ncbi:MAG: hypothetical protein US96_C0032G0013 [Candidatus Woesebacteria bacterium GW2011_GWB1_38_5b]|uniref:Carbohydrate-binding module family 96 domain-containing protein n=1 Tax=Candidatus Woesebacteria bacterium GW2011_GWB1_38_5b TaxID=1618569 RepID=A0A0G0ML20_9BACT|nr:MAG: hypothetical protein US96_C0032G0013 [Candidatus Woesebacteria bacterium GW2011_GWB1_38_5b]
MDTIAVPPQVLMPTPPPKKFPVTKIIIITYILLFLVVALAGFFAGFMQKPIFKSSPTPQPSAIPIVTTAPNPLQSPSSSPQPSGALQPESQTKTITSTSNLDGFASSNGSGNNTVDIRAGRNTFAVTRGFVSFDLSSLPDKISVESANLRIYQTHMSGDPYSAGGTLKIDHMEFGEVLDGNDYALAPLQTNLATLSPNANIEWKEVDVTQALKEDIKNSRLRSQYRLRFSLETIGGESGGDFAYLESGENFVGTSNIPQLVVRYKN